MKQRGFTLIEVLLALAIFTIIGLATVRHIQQIQATKEDALKILDSYSNVRAAISMIRFDISQAFHVLYEDLGAEAKSIVLQNGQVAHTLFDGRKKELIFTSLSRRVYYANLRECDQTEISYFLQPREGSSLPSLMKRESEIIDSDLYQGGSVTTLIDNVTNLEFQYWDNKTAKWQDDWNSDNGAFQDTFPQAVKMRIGTIGSDGQELTVDSEFKIAFPNNDPYLAQF